MRARKPLMSGCLLAAIAGAYAPDCMQLQGKLQNDLGPKGVCCDEGSCDGLGNTPTTCPPACAEVFIDSWHKCASMWSGYFISVGQGAYADALNRFFHLCKDAELANVNPRPFPCRWEASVRGPARPFSYPFSPCLHRSAMKISSGPRVLDGVSPAHRTLTRMARGRPRERGARRCVAAARVISATLPRTQTGTGRGGRAA